MELLKKASDRGNNKSVIISLGNLRCSVQLKRWNWFLRLFRKSSNIVLSANIVCLCGCEV